MPSWHYDHGVNENFRESLKLKQTSTLPTEILSITKPKLFNSKLNNYTYKYDPKTWKVVLVELNVITIAQVCLKPKLKLDKIEF